MQREEKSERSRRQVLDAALDLFSHRGYRGTSVRDIADAAGVSTGNVYHHFPDKESIFQTLLDEYRAATESRAYPFIRALMTGIFPDNLELLAFGARDSVVQYRAYITLTYVDVIEFKGTHFRGFYSDLAKRFADFLAEEGRLQEVEKRLRPGVSPVSALLMTSRLFFNYFSLEVLFGVEEPFGKNSGQIIEEMAEILRHGMVDKGRDEQLEP